MTYFIVFEWSKTRAKFIFIYKWKRRIILFVVINMTGIIYIYFLQTWLFENYTGVNQSTDSFYKIYHIYHRESLYPFISWKCLAADNRDLWNRNVVLFILLLKPMTKFDFSKFWLTTLWFSALRIVVKDNYQLIETKGRQTDVSKSQKLNRLIHTIFRYCPNHWIVNTRAWIATEFCA